MCTSEFSFNVLRLEKKKKLLSKFVQLPLKGLNESELPQIHFVLHLVWTQCYKTDVTKCCSPAAPEKPE